MDREQTIAVWDGGVRMRVLSAGAGPRAEEWLLVCQSPGPNVFECAQSVGELRPFSVEQGSGQAGVGCLALASAGPAAQGPKVRRLRAGGSRIRTVCRVTRQGFENG